MDQTEALLNEVRAARQMHSPETARVIRIAAKVSQARLANALGVNRSTVNRWETGEMQPRAAQRTRYFELLNELQRELAS